MISDKLQPNCGQTTMTDNNDSLFFPLSCVHFRMSILRIVAREILDSRGNPTVEVDLHTQKGKHTYWHVILNVLISLTY